jgi:hypothetical protein
MSRFLKICEEVEKYIKEQTPDTQMDPNMQTNVAPGEPVANEKPVLDPETQSEIQEVSNEQIQELIEVIINFYQKGTPLSSDSKMEIDRLPSKINSENSQKTVEMLINIFKNSNFPSNSFDTTQ